MAAKNLKFVVHLPKQNSIKLTGSQVSTLLHQCCVYVDLLHYNLATSYKDYVFITNCAG